jgi:hypothetical protein
MMCEQTSAERRMPPGPRGLVELLRLAGKPVIVRENKHGSLRYTIAGERERTAHELYKRALRLRVVTS